MELRPRFANTRGRLSESPSVGWTHAILAYRRPLIVGVHAAIILVSYSLASLLRFEFRPDFAFDSSYWRTLPVLLAVKLVVFGLFGLYRGLWQYVSTSDLLVILKATTAGSIVFAALEFVLKTGVPRSVFLMDWVLCFGFVCGVRVALRVFKEARSRARSSEAVARALVVGAGDGAERLIRQISNGTMLGYRVVGLVDDNDGKRRIKIHGAAVIGRIKDIPELAVKLAVDEVLIAIPSASAEQRREIMKYCRQTAVPVKTVPSLARLVGGRAGINQLDEVEPEDLLDRQVVQVEQERLEREITGSTVLVTGAGGSIGSELCRQIAKLEPKRLIMLERGESPLHFTQVELVERHTGVAFVPVVGDINDDDKVREVMREYWPDYVYHAAAYKHVPLMETHPLDAIANNVFGTETVARAARDHDVKKFVLISTDKAVRPVSTMGMTKRVAEDLLVTLGGNGTTFVSVRFGNVLGSAGSVLPLFQWQIAKGGPVTVTDPEATRYFMLISEAAQLVLQAGAMGIGGEVFFLDMGAPVRIQQLAEDVIRLSGMSPGMDMSVSTIGLRAGERMNEELVRETEEFLSSDHEMIQKVRGIEVDSGVFGDALEILRRSVAERNAPVATEILRELAGVKPFLKST